MGYVAENIFWRIAILASLSPSTSAIEGLAACRASDNAARVK